MSRKLVVVFIALAVAVAFAFSMAFAGDTLTINKAAAKKSGVTFNHTEHGKTIDCFECHHASKTKDDIKSCFECHGKDPAASDPASAKKDNPFHVQCKGCHKTEAKGPTKCKECHP